MEHQTLLPGFQSLQEAAEAICNLRYDALAELIGHMQDKLWADATADYDRDRKKLATALTQAGNLAGNFSLAVEDAWKICKPYMDQSKE
jgi:hypothetical protein